MPSPVLAFLLALLLVSASSPPSTEPTTELLVYDFHVYLEPAAAVEHLRGLGFAGVVTRVGSLDDVAKLDAYVQAAATHDDFRAMAYIAYDFIQPSSPNVWRDALPILAEAGAPLWVVVKNAPSDASIASLLRTMARASAAQGVRTVVYPHWNTSIETAAEAAELIEAAGHPNLRNSLHTAHEIRGGNQDDLPAVVDDHVDATALVAIAGAEADAYAGPWTFGVTWSDVIKPLDDGDFSLAPFLQALHVRGYQGPVILQTFGITNDPGHLKRSIRAYAEYQDELLPRRVPR